MNEIPDNYDDFRATWLDEILHEGQSPTAKGRAFALKIVHQWLNFDAANDQEDDNLFYCDGAGDGGIDLAYLQQGIAEDTPGDTWYLVQSKYGAAFQGEDTLLKEGRKVIETLQGERTNLSSVAQNLLERLRNFQQQQSENDKVVLVFATVDPLTQNEKNALADVRSIAKERLNFDFRVEAVSLRTIFDRLIEQRDAKESVCIPLSFEMTEPASEAELLVGTVALPDVYDFLRAYREKRGDLNALYEKNVRLFLNTKINKKIIETLERTPQLFGFYNNGVTIVVSDYHSTPDGLELCNPSVVNGCQTTRSLWEVFDKKERSGGTGKSNELAQWRVQAAKGVVIIKIVRVSSADSSDLLKSIVRFTNSQNAVKEQDFLALEADFRRWQDEMAAQGIYLEIQRGGADAQKARQKKNIKGPQFADDRFANAFELFKVYGAGWLGEPGQAWNKNADFLPGGQFFKTIVEVPINTPDFIECFHLQKAATNYAFGSRRKDTPPTRRLTRFLFYFVVLELLRRQLASNSFPDDLPTCTQALCALRESPSGEWKLLMDEAVHIIDNYMKNGAQDSFSNEPSFDGNLNAYLKSEGFAKRKEFSPCLWQWFGRADYGLTYRHDNTASRAERIVAVMENSLNRQEV